MEEGRAGRGITYVTLPAVLEADAGGNAYAFVTAYTDGCIKIDGVGAVPSCVVVDYLTFS